MHACRAAVGVGAIASHRMTNDHCWVGDPNENTYIEIDN